MIAILALPVSTHAARFQAAENLRNTVETFLQKQASAKEGEDIEISVGRLDPRLKLASCASAPQAFLAPGARLQGKFSVGLRCTAPKPWTVYVPAQIRRFADVIAAAQPLLRGSEISAADVMSVRLELSHLHGGYYRNIKNVVGKIVTRNLTTGQAITPKRIKAPILVHRGEKVSIIADVGALRVRGKGVALRDAAQGELVSVRNSRSKRIIQGVVKQPGTVHVKM